MEYGVLNRSLTIGPCVLCVRSAKLLPLQEVRPALCEGLLDGSRNSPIRYVYYSFWWRVVADLLFAVRPKLR